MNDNCHGHLHGNLHVDELSSIYANKGITWQVYIIWLDTTINKLYARTVPLLPTTSKFGCSFSWVIDNFEDDIRNPQTLEKWISDDNKMLPITTSPNTYSIQCLKCHRCILTLSGHCGEWKKYINVTQVPSFWENIVTDKNYKLSQTPVGDGWLQYIELIGSRNL